MVKNGISRFNSVKEINDFLSNYDSERHKILNDTSKRLQEEYTQKCSNLQELAHDKNEKIVLETKNIDSQIADLQLKIDTLGTKKNNNFFSYILSSTQLYYKKKRLNHFINNKTTLINLTVNMYSEVIRKNELFIKDYESNKQILIDKRAKPEIKQLENTRKVIEDSKNLIAGAIGENLVVKEIKKLSDDYVLINDFNLNFYPPIYNQRENERIYSIQIDHLLISKSGIFIIETKNWSKLSVNSINLRSPIEQIRRSNFALYVYISENINLNEHHWGEQKIPVRNVIVMINNKPSGEFKYVNVKLLTELNDYIRYFEPVLTERQMNKIVNNLT
ncbi:MAG: nuclease-related domain-containing protein [Aquaticitalea sp.]